MVTDIVVDTLAVVVTLHADLSDLALEFLRVNIAHPRRTRKKHPERVFVSDFY